MVSDFKAIECNGCRVCADVCPVNAISFKRDDLTGFDYPVIDNDRCISCNLCEKKCPNRYPVRLENRFSPKVYAAWSNNDEIRLLCTSGGIFYELGKYVIEALGGVVVACSYTDDYRGSFHCIARNIDELIPQCGSKHVQSETAHIYRKVKDLLNERFVFFVGTPCQVAALYRYLGPDYEKLLTADFICNSINSPKAQEKYIDYLEERFNSRIIFSRAKDKRYGWNNFGSSAKFENGEEYYASRNEDPRVVGYHHGHLFVRESCTDCKYKVIPRNADITLADFWGIEADPRNPKMEEGTSLVMVNSSKGEKIFKSLGPSTGFYEKSLGDAVKGNQAIYTSCKRNGNSELAFKALDSERFDIVVDKYRSHEKRRSVIFRVASRIKRVMKKIIRGEK